MALELHAVALHEDAALFLFAGAARLFAHRGGQTTARWFARTAWQPRAAVPRFADRAIEPSEADSFAAREARAVVALDLGRAPRLIFLGRGVGAARLRGIVSVGLGLGRWRRHAPTSERK